MKLPKSNKDEHAMSDKEIAEMEARNKREELLSKLLEVSKKNKPQSISKSVPKSDPNKNNDIVIKSISELEEEKEDSYGWAEDLIWEQLLPEGYIGDNENDTIDRITENNLYDYQFGAPVEEKTEYANIFKSEIAMLSKVLKDLNDISKSATKRLASYNKKGSAGPMSKTYSDTLNSVVQTHKARADAIDMIAKLKTKQAELAMKAKKDEGPAELSVDDAVAQFYSTVMSGGRSEFVQNAMSVPMEYEDEKQIPLSDPRQNWNQDFNNETSNSSFNGKFDLTAPIEEYDDYDEASDSTGYIRNENRDVEVVLIKHSDGSYEFSAIDADGEEVDNYELPGNDLLETLSIRPLSPYAYDKYSRRYRIIDYGSNVDISDI